MVAFLGVRECHPIGHFLAEYLDAAFRIAVGVVCVGPSADLLETQDGVGLGQAV